MNNIIKRKWNQNSMVIIEDLQGMAFQAESGGHTFQISGIDGEGNTVALSGTPAGVMLRADGQDVTLTCSVSGGVVSATLPANAYVVPGRFGLTIFLTSDGQKTAIYAAVGTVGKTSSGTVAPPAGSDVVDLVNAIAAAVATIPASYTDLMAAMAPTYSSSGLYAVGSYAWYNGKLYRCTTAITSGETWTSGHWTLANLGSDLVDLKSALSGYTQVNQLTSSDNLNNVTKPGAYYIAPNNYPTNYPFTNVGGRLFVVKSVNESSKTFMWQLIVTSSPAVMKYRCTADGSYWTNWKTVLTTDDVDTTLAVVGAAADAKTVGDKFDILSGYMQVNQLTSSDDLNNVTKPGAYYIATNNYPTNYPFTNIGGRLFVVKSVNESTKTFMWQLIVTSSPAVMQYRCTADGSYWTNWKIVATADDLNVLSGYTQVNQLTSSNDMNDVTKSGVYYIATGNYPTNYPFTNIGGRLLVVKSVNESSKTFMWQLIVTAYSGVMKYRNTIDGTTWNEWKTVATIDDIPSTESIIKYIPLQIHNISGTIPTLDEEKASGGYSDYVSTIYGFWDALMAQYPQFITKEALTLDDDIVQSLPSVSNYENGATVLVQSSNGYVQYRKINNTWKHLHTWKDGAEYDVVKMSKTIYAYTIAPYKNRQNRGKVVWVSGLHGHEKVTHIATCYMFKELLSHFATDNELSHFLTYNDIVVIPIADVTGTENTYGTHGMTENYVNPNRDYPVDWEESQVEYNQTGNEPAYDPYTRMIMNYISSLDNVSYLVNKHDSSSLSSAKFIGYFVDSSYPLPYKYEMGVFDQLDAWIRFRYPWIYTDFVGSGWNPDSTRLLRNLTSIEFKGTLDKWTTSIGIKGGLFEISADSGTDYSMSHTSDFPKIHAELSLNFLSGMIKYLEQNI